MLTLNKTNTKVCTGDHLERIVLVKDLEAYVGFISRATRYKWIKEGLFPRPFKLSPKKNAWRESDLIAFREQRIAQIERNAAASIAELRNVAA